MGLPGFGGDEPDWTQVIETLRMTLAKHNMPYSGLALGDDNWLEARGEGRSLMFTSSDCVAVLGLAEELRHVRELFPARDYSTENKGKAVGEHDS